MTRRLNPERLKVNIGGSFSGVYSYYHKSRTNTNEWLTYLWSAHTYDNRTTFRFIIL